MWWDGPRVPGCAAAKRDLQMVPLDLDLRYFYLVYFLFCFVRTCSTPLPPPASCLSCHCLCQPPVSPATARHSPHSFLAHRAPVSMLLSFPYTPDTGSVPGTGSKHLHFLSQG